MTEQEYWDLIEKSNGGNESCKLEKQTMRLRELLDQLTETELLDYIRISIRQDWRAYRWDLWALAYIAFLGCSDDTFEEFRAWLTSRGKRAFERALVDLDFAALLVRENLQEPIGAHSESFLMLPTRLYENKFGVDPLKILPEDEYVYGKREPAGVEWKEEQVFERFPTVCALFNRKRQDFNIQS